VNYEDPNYNVAMPIFVIHGNHDDPSGDGNLSPIDLLATAGLVNYFGKTASVDDITMVPILLRKGETKLALYGLGGIRDERLHRTFLQKKVKMMRPLDTDDSSWFSMLILHQNRVPHGPTNYIPETFLDDFLDLVVWGHEHESMACDPTVCTQRGFMVCQPGSSVATSLCEGEAKRKHAVILSVTGTDFETTAIPLKTVRPFMTKDVALRDAIPRIAPADANAINKFLCDQVDDMIAEVMEDHVAEPPMLPLIRLRVDCALPFDAPSGEPPGKAVPYAIVNPQRFGQQYTNRVANPRDILHYLRRKGGAAAAAAQRRLKPIQHPADGTALPAEDPADVRVEDLVARFLGCQKLDIFPQNEFGDILRTSIEKTDNSLIERFVKDTIGRIVSIDRAEAPTDGNPIVCDVEALKAEFERLKKRREEEWHRLHPTIESVLMDPTISKTNEGAADDEDAEGDEEEEEHTPASTARGRGRGQGGRGAATATRATTSTRGRGRGRGGATSQSRTASSPVPSEDEFVNDENDSEEEPIQAPNTTARAKRAAEAAPAAVPAPKKRAAAPVVSAWPSRKRA
jgi:double-strand break repair protein MRE11